MLDCFQARWRLGRGGWYRCKRTAMSRFQHDNMMQVTGRTVMKYPVFGLLLALSWNAQAATGFLSGEETSGMTKTCYYDVLGSTVAKTISSVSLCPLSIQYSNPPATNQPAPAPPKSAYITAFHTGERTSGMTKICYYEFGGSQYTKTISSVALCPLSIQVRL